MKLKTALSLAVFAFCFSISLGSMSILTARFASSFFRKEISSEQRIKLYNFLREDRDHARTSFFRLGMRTNPNQGQIFLEANALYAEDTAKLDTSGLPEDFQIAWKRYSTAKFDIVTTYTHLKSMPEKLSFDKTELPVIMEKFDAEHAAWATVKDVSSSYGVELGPNLAVELLP